MSSVDSLAEFISTLTYDDIEEASCRRAKLCILDSVGCTVGGSIHGPGPKMISLMERLGGAGESSILTRKKRISVPNAAYANAYLANLLDYDDGYTGLGHPGACIIGTALAVGDMTRASGKEVITAIALGYEVAIRIGTAIRPSLQREKEVRGQATWAIFGSGTAAAKLMKLETNEIADTLSLCAMHAPVPFLRKFLRPKPINPLKNNFGWSSQGGVFSAILAKEGFYGNHTILDDPNGFWLMSGSDRCDFDVLNRGLGLDFVLANVAFKPYPSCRHTHSSLDALRDIITSNDLRPKQLSAITVRSSPKILDYMDYNPTTSVEMQRSIPFLFAAMLLKIDKNKWLDPEHLNDQSIIKLAKKVRFEADEASSAAFEKHGIVTRAEVTVTTKTGEKKRGFQEYPRGSPENPLTQDFLERKFLALCEPLVAEKARSTLELILSLENVEDVRDPLSMLAAS